ncbi:uncharacterized protein ACA1_344480 [Acanthamoeba castellanii str. Neff]|uniref:Uncharacterized protein n=1 Tax=Acanthamoeba castellanii (strain ATCC 30010 / Neff) TaxID=1257118 RepID=L8GFW3_ACACF|nr:uncharacterized protein ACA1_344480 [Acanthamoeba castellanii str. Neff]ELR11066.1 hypothetical protein ACA1_344480 [Acanthamoeba castellanii str. Neff]
MSGTDRPEVPSILVSSPTRQEHDLPADAGARTPTTPSSPFSSGALPTSAAPSPSVRVPPSPFSPPLSSRARPTRTAAGGASPLASPASPAAADTVSTVTSTLSRFTAHRPYRTPDMGLEVLQVDVDTAKVNPTYTVHLEGECTLNTTPETRKDIQEHPRAAQLLKANKDLVKGFAGATLKLRFDFVHKDTKQMEHHFATGVAVAPNLVLTVR